MARPFSGKNRVHTDRQGRRTTWARSVNLFTLAAAGNYSTLNLLAPFTTSGGNPQGVTIVRTHLHLVVSSGVAANDTFTWGLLKGQATDVGANIAGAPTPDLQPYEDWLMWRDEIADTNAAYFPAQSNNHEFDIKAQRRLPELQMTYNMVVKRQATVAALTVNAVISTLIMLP
jgi:hypothetical protein